MTALTAPMFKNEDKAREHFEAIRWPEGPVCSHCGVVNQATLVQGKSHRPGLYQCNACRQPFTVTTGTVMESSHVPLSKWALAFHLMASSKKGISAHQLHRMLGVTYKTAWFMAHRIRESMTAAPKGPLGQGGKFVEVDETYIGHDRAVPKPKGGPKNKLKVISLVERGGEARSFHVENFTRQNIQTILTENLSPQASLMTDESSLYKHASQYVGSHDTVNHGEDEYVRGDAYTNTVEGFFSVFKRGMKGVYQHCAEKHLHRYLSEFDFRYSNRIALGIDDGERRTLAIKNAAGKRLTYRGRH